MLQLSNVARVTLPTPFAASVSISLQKSIGSSPSRPSNPVRFSTTGSAAMSLSTTAMLGRGIVLPPLSQTSSIGMLVFTFGGVGRGSVVMVASPSSIGTMSGSGTIAASSAIALETAPFFFFLFDFVPVVALPLFEWVFLFFNCCCL